MASADRIAWRPGNSHQTWAGDRGAKLWEALRCGVTARLIFPASNYLLNRQHIRRTFARSRQSQWYSQEQLREIQLEKLKRVLHDAYASVPFYRRRFVELGLRPEDIQTLDDLRHVPPVCRRDVVEHGEEMVGDRWTSSLAAAQRRPASSLGAPISLARFRRHKLVKCSSSGSSGEPVLYYENGSKSAASWAFELLLKSWYGIAPGAAESRFMRLSSDYLPSSAKTRLRRLLWRQWILPGLSLSAREYETCLDAILRLRPSVLWGFVSAITGLAEFVREHRKPLGAYRPELIVGWAEPTYDHQRQLLAEVFQCRVTSLYSCHEVGHIAAQCPHGRFHVNQEQLLLETEPATSPAAQSQPAEVMVTSLYDTPMPFIRYRLGDVAQLGTEGCSCGRNLQTISHLAGRASDLFVTAKGRMIAPNFWCHLLRRGRWAEVIRQFQVVYRRDGSFRLNLVTPDRLSPSAEEQLRALIAHGLEEDMPIELAYVAEIPRLRSGKSQIVAREM